MIHDHQLLEQFHSLPKDKQSEVIDFIEFLKTKSVQPLQEKTEKRPFGVLKGKIWMAEDFDAPLEDFAEYM